MSRATLYIALAVIALSYSADTCKAGEPGWARQVITRGAQREYIQSHQMIYRPYRPFHFYGNTVRRIYYRGSLRPTLHDLQMGTSMLVSGR